LVRNGAPPLFAGESFKGSVQTGITIIMVSNPPDACYLSSGDPEGLTQE